MDKLYKYTWNYSPYHQIVTFCDFLGNFPKLSTRNTTKLENFPKLSTRNTTKLENSSNRYVFFDINVTIQWQGLYQIIHSIKFCIRYEFGPQQKSRIRFYFQFQPKMKLIEQNFDGYGEFEFQLQKFFSRFYRTNTYFISILYAQNSLELHKTALDTYFVGIQADFTLDFIPKIYFIF